ncbi:hypothetical protein PDE_00327 [Penicillium oxalicum 114-2]|uniref:Uncharacterized protein n=1 Tax=Penicillium oxalicum (strain 114-2 / CGMCC 5302) TaxID=933388 RepID=S7Z5L2_PENO1|nr:hypothetical protein PDE_00327 [Penicillium oxalicum 114-2]
MCGESSRSTSGGTIAVLFPLDRCCDRDSSERSLSSSPQSTSSVTTSSSYSTSSSSYSLFFQESENRSPGDKKTKALLHFADGETYQTFCDHPEVEIRIEKHGDLSARLFGMTPLHAFRLDLSKGVRTSNEQGGREIEVDLRECLDLTVSARGVVGRQVTLCSLDGTALGTGIIGYN